MVGVTIFMVGGDNIYGCSLNLFGCSGEEQILFHFSLDMKKIIFSVEIMKIKLEKSIPAEEI